MGIALFGALVFALVVTGYGVLYRRTRQRRIGTAAAGTMFDLLNEDRRNAVEIVVEDKAAASEPESADDKVN